MISPAPIPVPAVPPPSDEAELRRAFDAELADAEPGEWLPVGVPMTPAEYLAREWVALEKSEYRDGQAFAMAGASYAHAVIASNIVTALNGAARARGCRTLASDLKVADLENNRYFYPDVVIVCGSPTFKNGDRRDILTNPAIIVEVLSPSTERRDRGEKFREYQKIASLREYVLIDQNTQAVERFVRQSDSDLWIYSLATGANAVARFETIEADVPLTAIYEGAGS